MKKMVVWLTDKPECMAQMANVIFPILWEAGVTSMVGVLNGKPKEVEALATAVYEAWVATGADFGYGDEEMQEFEKFIRLNETTEYGTDTVKSLNYPFSNRDAWVDNIIADFPDDVLYGVDIAIRTATLNPLEQSIFLDFVLMELKKPAFLFNTLVAPVKSTSLWRNVYKEYTGIDVSNMPVWDRRGMPIETSTNTRRLPDYIIESITTLSEEQAVE